MEDSDPHAGEFYETYATGSKYCKKLLYLHPIEHTFYYRSTPFRASKGRFIGDTDGIKGGNSSDNEHSQGDMARHILYANNNNRYGVKKPVYTTNMLR